MYISISFFRKQTTHTHTHTHTHKELSWDVINFLLLWSSALLSVLVLISLLLSFSVQFLFREVLLPHCRFKGYNAINTWYLIPRVHKNKSMQHHTLRSGTAEFQVTWPPKLREGTYLVKNVRARFEYRKTIAAHEKQVIMQEKAQPCASLWRKTLRPNRVRFLAIDAPIVDYVCLPLYHLTFLPLCNLSASFREEKRKKKRDKRVQVSSINSWRESAVYRAALPHRYTILYNTQKSRYLKFRRASAPQWRDQALHTLVLMYSCWYHRPWPRRDIDQKVRSRRSATFTPSAHVRRQSLPVWPPTLNITFTFYLYQSEI